MAPSLVLVETKPGCQMVLDTLGVGHAAILNHASWLINPGLADVLHG